MSPYLKPVLLFLLPMFLTLHFCTKSKDKPAPPSNECEAKYGEHIKPIVSSRCAIEGCHVSGFPFGDFSKYQDLKLRADNGKLEDLVINRKIMPPSGSSQLTNEQIQTLQCWIDNGAPED